MQTVYFHIFTALIDCFFLWFRIQSDMDVPTSTLIGAHGYCTQVCHINTLQSLSWYTYESMFDFLLLDTVLFEFCTAPVCSVFWYDHVINSYIFPFIFLKELVNLLLCGQAVSNVFDNELKLDSGNGNVTLLKGITARCNVGLLSLFEHYNICEVIWLQTYI